MVSRQDAIRSQSIHAGTLEDLVETLLMAFGDDGLTHILIFLSTYKAFASTKTVVQLLLDRYPLYTGRVDSILRTWLDHCPEDFKEHPDYPCLYMLMDYVQEAWPESELLTQAKGLLKQLQHQAYRAVFQEEKVEIRVQEDFLSFKADLVAEQLTHMDAVLFKKVVTRHCLGAIWPLWDEEKCKHSAPTVYATFSQLDALVACIISTVLKEEQTSQHLRARVIKRWIDIAQGCRILNNFSSLRAILLALQSDPLCRLKSAWACVCKKRMQMLQELLDVSSDDFYLNSRGLLMSEGTSNFASVKSCANQHQNLTHKGGQLQRGMGAMKGTVPDLGTFLTELGMLDTTLPDLVEGGLINLEKRRMEYEVLAKIKLLQSDCNDYCPTPDPAFLQWFKSQQQQSKEERLITGAETMAAGSPASEIPCSSPTGKSGEIIASDGVSHSDSEGLPPNTQQSQLSEPSSCNPLHAMDNSSSPASVPQTAASPSLPAPPNTHSSIPQSQPPVCNIPAEGTCIIRICLKQDKNIFKNILVTCQDKTPAVISRVMAEYNLAVQPKEGYELVQLISKERDLVFPHDANVLYAMKPSANCVFLMRVRHWPIPLGSRYSSKPPRISFSRRFGKVILGTKPRQSMV